MKNLKYIAFLVVVLFQFSNYTQAQSYFIYNDQQSFSGDRVYNLSVSDIPGVLKVAMSEGGTYNSLCKSSFKIYVSADNSNFTEVGSFTRFNSTFNYNLGKNIRYFRFVFSKCWSSNLTCKATISISKSLDVSTSAMTDFLTSVNTTQSKTFTVNYSNVSGPISLSLEGADAFKVSPTTFGSAGASGSQVVTVDYKPYTLGNHEATLRVADSGYTDSYSIIDLAGIATLDVPANVMVKNESYSSMDVTWNTVGGATDYWLKVVDTSNANEVFAQAVGNVNGFSLTTLQPNKTYEVSVCSEYNGLFSLYSVPVTASTLNMIPVANAPTDITESSFIAHWNAVANVEGYYVTLTNARTGVVVADNIQTPALYHAFTSLETGECYVYSVKAYRGSVVSQASNAINTQSLKYLPLMVNQESGIGFCWLSASNMTGWDGSKGYVLNKPAWMQVAFNAIPKRLTANLYVRRNNSSAFDYFPQVFIESSADGASWTQLAKWDEGNPSGVSSYERQKAFDISLDVSVRYVRVRREGGEDDAWAYVNYLNIDPLLVNVHSATEVSYKSFVMSWDAVANATDYKVSLYTKNGENKVYVSDWNSKSVGNVTSLALDGLSQVTTYFYTVEAVVANYTTPRSNELNTTTESAIATPIVGEATEITDSSAMLNWNTVDGATGYYVSLYLADGTVVYSNMNVTADSVMVSNLFEGTQYYYNVRAYNDLATSALSANSSIFETGTNSTESGLSLPYSYASDIKFASNMSRTFEFKGIPGKVVFTTTKGGTYNFINYSYLIFEESADGANWSQVAKYGNDFAHSNKELDLKKSTKFLKITFSKGGTNDSYAVLKAGSIITKSLRPLVKAMSDFSDDAGDAGLVKTFKVTYSNLAGEVTVQSNSDNFVVSPTQFGGAKQSGEQEMQVTFVPDGINDYNAKIIFTDQGHILNAEEVILGGKAIVQSVTNLKAGTPTYSTVPLTWGIVPNAKSYKVVAVNQVDLSEIVFTEITNGNFTVTGLAMATNYRFDVYAQFTATQSVPVSVVAATTTVHTVALDATDIQPNRFTANWQVTTEATGYELMLYELTEGGARVASSNSPISVGKQINYTFTSLSFNTSYIYTVMPKVGVFNGEVSNEIGVTTQKSPVTLVAPVLDKPLSYGMQLKDASFLNGVAKDVNNDAVAGSFFWNTPEYVPAVGENQMFDLVFVPADLTRYVGATISVAYDVIKCSPILQKLVATPITYKQTLADAALTASAVNGGGHPVVGTLSWVLDSSFGPNAGNKQLFAIKFTPVDLVNYVEVTGYVELDVAKAAQTIIWDQQFNQSGVGTEHELIAASDANLPISFDVDLGELAAIQGSTLHLLKSGIVSVSAMQAGDDNFEAAATVTKTIQILDNVTGLNSITVDCVIYPNPAKEFVKVMADRIEYVSLVDMTGRTLLNRSFDQVNEVRLEVSALVNGSYVLVVRCEKGTATKTIIINN